MRAKFLLWLEQMAKKDVFHNLYEVLNETLFLFTNIFFVATLK